MGEDLAVDRRDSGEGRPVERRDISAVDEGAALDGKGRGASEPAFTGVRTIEHVGEPFGSGSERDAEHYLWFVQSKQDFQDDAMPAEHGIAECSRRTYPDALVRWPDCRRERAAWSRIDFARDPAPLAIGGPGRKLVPRCESEAKAVSQRQARFGGHFAEVAAIRASAALASTTVNGRGANMASPPREAYPHE